MKLGVYQDPEKKEIEFSVVILHLKKDESKLTEVIKDKITQSINNEALSLKDYFKENEIDVEYHPIESDLFLRLKDEKEKMHYMKFTAMIDFGTKEIAVNITDFYASEKKYKIAIQHMQTLKQKADKLNKLATKN